MPCVLFRPAGTTSGVLDPRDVALSRNALKPFFPLRSWVASELSAFLSPWWWSVRSLRRGPFTAGSWLSSGTVPGGPPSLLPSELLPVFHLHQDIVIVLKLLDISHWVVPECRTARIAPGLQRQRRQYRLQGEWCCLDV